MQLATLLGGVHVLERRGDPSALDVTSVTHDSRAVRPGALFCCVPGSSVDGHDFAAEAVGLGAVALLCERPVDADVPQVLVASTRRAMGPIAAAFHGHPSRRLAVAGITGTNGKTTTAHLLAAVLEAHGWPTGVIGTLGGPRTTPEAPALQALLAGFVAEGRGAVAMEVSSHALAQHRVDGTWFSLAAFTNLSQDHLDFHGDMESYFRAKASLFRPDLAGEGVVNADDPYGQRLLERAAIPLRPFSLAQAEGVEVTAGGATFRWEGNLVRLRLGGLFNVANALCAAACARALGVDAATVAEALSAVTGVPGRFERVDAGQPFAVVVDYAHTPVALEQVLLAARAAAAPGGRVLVVVGCGGERDRAKRPAMGRVAASADIAVLTSDNPRGEDPARILDEMRAGVPCGRDVAVVADRAEAVARAIGAAKPGDVVVIAGKGHETGQTAGGRTVAFDDRAVARRVLEELM